MDRKAALEAGVYAFQSLCRSVQVSYECHERKDPPYAPTFRFCREVLEHALDVIAAEEEDGPAVLAAAERMAFFLISGHDPVEEECKDCACWRSSEKVCSQVRLGYPCDPAMRPAYERGD